MAMAETVASRRADAAVANVTDRRFGSLGILGIVGVVALALTACGGDTKGSPTSTTAAPVSTEVVSAQPVATQAPTAEDATALKEAVAALGANYHFVTTATVNGSTVLTAEGDRVGDGARLMLTSDAGAVSYVVTADGSWAKPENGTWAALDVPAATTDPLSALGSPSIVAKVPDSPLGQDYAAVVQNDALGISGGGTATLVVTVVDGRVTAVTYTSVVSGQAAQVTTVLSAVTNAEPVVAPV